MGWASSGSPACSPSLPAAPRKKDWGLAPHPGTSIFGGIPHRFLLLSTNPFSSALMHL